MRNRVGNRPLGTADIAELLHTDRHTPQVWYQRAVLPTPDWVVNQRYPVWTQATIVRWALATGRWPVAA